MSEFASIRVFPGGDCVGCGQEIKRGEVLFSYYDDGHLIELHRDCAGAGAVTQKGKTQ